MIDAKTLRGWCQELRDVLFSLNRHAANLRANDRRVPPDLRDALLITITVLGEIEGELPEVQAAVGAGLLHDAGVTP